MAGASDNMASAGDKMAVASGVVRWPSDLKSAAAVMLGMVMVARVGRQGSCPPGHQTRVYAKLWNRA